MAQLSFENMAADLGFLLSEDIEMELSKAGLSRVWPKTTSGVHASDQISFLHLNEVKEGYNMIDPISTVYNDHLAVFVFKTGIMLCRDGYYSLWRK